MATRTERLRELELAGITFYFKGSAEDVVFKFVPGTGYFVKWPGRDEGPISPEKSRMLMDSLLEFEEATKKEYNDF